MAKRKEPGMSLADQLVAGLMNSTGKTLNVIEFVEELCDAFDKTMFKEQKVLLKAVYGLPFDDDELEIIQRWYAEKKTNWLPNELVLAEINSDRSRKGMMPRTRFDYLEVILGIGMRCLAGSALIEVKGQGLVKLESLLPEAASENLETELDIEVMTRQGFKKVSHGLSRPPCKTIKLTSSKGLTIEGSFEHPLVRVCRLTLQEEWVEMSELQIGDLILLGDLATDEIVELTEGYSPVYDICVPEVSEYIANGIVSHNSGKSSTVGLIVAYEFYKMLIDPNPQRTLGIPSSSTIFITVLATTERQTTGTIFSYVKNYITGSTFFKAMIERGEIIPKELEITAPGKNLVIGCGHSKADALVGRTAILVAFDELAMFCNDDGKTSNASDVYSRVGRATATFPEHGRRIALSSAKEDGDFMQELTNDGWDKQKRGTLVFDLSTFDFNPLRTMDDPVISSDYQRDPVAAARDYENIRPSSSYAFINPFVVDAATRRVNPEGISEAIDPEKYCLYRPMEIYRPNPSNPTEKLQTSGLEISRLIPIIGEWSSIAHGDPGLEHDSYGFACGHGEVSQEGLITVIDICLEWRAKELGKGKRATIDYNNVEDIIIEIARARRIQRMSFDGWSSAGSIQRLIREGVPAFKMNFGRAQQTEMYDSLRTRLNAGLVKIPNHPVLVEELKNLQISSSGEKIDHPKSKDSNIPGRGKISKDIADCIAVVNWQIATQERMFARDVNHQFFNPLANGGSVQPIGGTRALDKVDWKFGQGGYGYPNMGNGKLHKVDWSITQRNWDGGARR